MLLLELDESRPQQTFGHIRELLSTSPDLEVFLTASRTDPQLLLEAFRVGVKEFLPQPLTRQEVEPALARFEERFRGRTAEVGWSVRKGGLRDRRQGRCRSEHGGDESGDIRSTGRQRESVALVDLDMHGGDLGLFLDLHASQGLQTSLEGHLPAG